LDITEARFLQQPRRVRQAMRGRSRQRRAEREAARQKGAQGVFVAPPHAVNARVGHAPAQVSQAPFWPRLDVDALGRLPFARALVLVAFHPFHESLLFSSQFAP
jgi:hypothetical protein